ncbi:MAG: haloacid dehalogenase-like hydrolase [Erysipelotrichaceae bacterium]|nr:haloacid dehalogenase-like hydrolase [Erysipelotrichaceae bacterium]
MYDFDKTLTYKDMQEYSLISELGYENPGDFWSEVTKLKIDNNMDGILAYLYMLLKKSESANRPIRKEDFEILGKDIEFFPGVITWFDRINEIGKELGLEIEHYIISSGMKEIIDGTSISKHFRKVYACRYYYDVNNVAKWPSLVVNYTTKTQYIFRINKQILDEYEDDALNEYTEDSKRPIPFKRMIYIGDGMTDVPCMKLVKEYGGKSIAVFNPANEKTYKTSKSLVDKGRANFMCEANYEAEKEMENLVKKILSYMSFDEALDENKYVEKKI